MYRFELDAPDLDRVADWLRSQPEYAPVAFLRLEDEALQETYLDTEDWSLSRARFSLCIQEPEGLVRLSRLKSRKGGLRELEEWTQPLPEYSVGSGREGVAQRVKLITNEAPLQTLFQLETARQVNEVRDGGLLLGTILLDTISVIRSGDCLRTFCRVRVGETQASAGKALQPVVEGMAEACGLAPSESSVLAAGLDAAGLTPRSPASGDAELGPDSTSGEYAYAVLRGYFEDVRRHEPGTRLGEDPEALHDMRVAIRRFRAATSIFKEVLSPQVLELRDELKWIGRELGAVRDLDVQSIWLSEERKASGWEQSVALGPLLEQIAAERSSARANLLEALSSERYVTLMASLKAALRETYETEAAAEPVRLGAARLLRKRFSQLEGPATNLTPESPATDYHAVRIRGKRFRYALEAFVPAFGSSERIERVIESTKGVQDLLGDFQDCVTAIERLQAMVRGASLPAATVFLMGQLAERRRSRMEEIREAWPEAFTSLQRNWNRARRALRARPDAPESETEAAERDQMGPPGPRQFWLLRRFVGPRRRGRQGAEVGKQASSVRQEE